MDEDTARELIAALDECRDELRRTRREGIVMRLPEAEREEIARRVYERLDERMASSENRAEDRPPARGQKRRGKNYF